MTGERPEAPELQISGTTPESVAEPEWKARVRIGVERSMRRRAARAEQRRVLNARRKAGLQARHATRWARLDAEDMDPP
ncbi:hypothetical protein ACTMTJ_07000 [Phytohabitans sp. LJ34]|uniref:hypothetical protein n=1 Tax=Phytohabitans sp. LJ34 TaxID=3452217 RepID=UPI003F8AEB02